MGLVARYAPTALFSLKPSLATSSGGTTLLAPTPYALKMALLDVAYRTLGIVAAELLWPTLRDLQVAYRPPQFATISNLFTRILKPSRSDPKGPPADPYTRSIGYREYVQFSEPLGLAVTSANSGQADCLARLMASLNYLGKRGGFVQLLAPPEELDECPAGFVVLNPPDGQGQFDARGTLQLLDDCGSGMTVAQANNYSGKSIRFGRERLSQPIILPYRVVRASKSYTLYRRLD